MVMARRMPRVSDAVRIPRLLFRHLSIDFDRDDPRPRVEAEVEAFAPDMEQMHTLYEAGAILIGPEASLFTEIGLRIDRDIDIASPFMASGPRMRARGQVYTSGREGSIVILAHVPHQRRAWRITIELDRGERIPPPEPLTIHQPFLAEMVIDSARQPFYKRGDR